MCTFEFQKRIVNEKDSKELLDDSNYDNDDKMSSVRANMKDRMKQRRLRRKSSKQNMLAQGIILSSHQSLI